MSAETPRKKAAPKQQQLKWSSVIATEKQSRDFTTPYPMETQIFTTSL